MATNEELIKQMYDSNLASNKAQLQQSYQKADSEYAAAKEKNAQVTDQNLSRTAVEGQKAAMNMAQLHDAQGLSSGTRAQARLSLENQTAANMTALRAAQQQSDADIERQRALLAQDYSAAIAKAQADNDLQKAQALYEQAKSEEDQLRSNQLSVAKMLAEAGDYSMYRDLGILTEEQAQQLTNAYWGTNGSKVPDGYTVTNRTGNGWVAIGNGRMTNEELKRALISGQIIRLVDSVNKTVTYEYAHPGVTGDGTPIGNSGNEHAASKQYPQLQRDGTFLIDGKTFTVDELMAALGDNSITYHYDNATGTYTYSIPRTVLGGSSGGPFGPITQKIKE